MIHSITSYYSNIKTTGGNWSYICKEVVTKIIPLRSGLCVNRCILCVGWKRNTDYRFFLIKGLELTFGEFRDRKWSFFVMNENVSKIKTFSSTKYVELLISDIYPTSFKLLLWYVVDSYNILLDDATFQKRAIWHINNSYICESTRKFCLSFSLLKWPDVYQRNLVTLMYRRFIVVFHIPLMCFFEQVNGKYTNEYSGSLTP